jgi:hypothetical protein
MRLYLPGEGNFSEKAVSYQHSAISDRHHSPEIQVKICS